MADVWSPECIYSKGGRVKKLEKGKVTHERQNPPHNSRSLICFQGRESIVDTADLVFIRRLKCAA